MSLHKAAIDSAQHFVDILKNSFSSTPEFSKDQIRVSLRPPSPMSPDTQLALFPRFPPILESPDATVYFEYSLPSSTSTDVKELPPCKEGWTRFVCISDTHGHTFPVPDGDVLLHSGDMTGTGTLKDFETTVDWLCELPHQHKM